MRIDYNKGGLLSRDLIQLDKQSSHVSPSRPAKVMLVFPPDWYPSEPYLSLPTLTAFIRAAGHDVIQKDVNLEMYDWFFSGDFLRRVLKKVPQQLDRLKKISRQRELTEPEMDLQMALCDCSRSRIAELTEKAEQAKQDCQKSQSFMNPRNWNGRLMSFVRSRQRFPWFIRRLRICMPPMETDLSYKLFMSSEVLEAVHDTQVNVYRDVFEHILKPAIISRKTRRSSAFRSCFDSNCSPQ